MRGLTDREYDELEATSTPCDGVPDDGPSMPRDEEQVCEALKARGLVCDAGRCSCGWTHYATTPLGHVAMHVCDAVRAFDGGK